jgi:hypothetical protein
MAKKPDLVFYSLFVSLNDFEILAKCATTTEYISSNYQIYADSLLTNPIGYITNKIIQDEYITSFMGYVRFTSFPGTLNYTAVNLVGADQPYFLDTIISGSGDLFGVSGYVVVKTNEDKDYLTNYVYFDKK